MNISNSMKAFFPVFLAAFCCTMFLEIDKGVSQEGPPELIVPKLDSLNLVTPKLKSTKPGSGKLPVPETKARNEVIRLIKSVYEKDYDAAKTPEQKRDLAKKIYKDGLDTKDTTERFVMLKVAKSIATKAGDGRTASQILHHMAREYEIDLLKMNMEILKEVSQLSKTPDQHKAMALAALKMFEQAFAKDRHDLAKELIDIAVASARKSNDLELVKKISDRKKGIAEDEKIYAQVKKALVKLEEYPTDAEANLTVGTYWCFYKGQWKKGLPMLALSENVSLKSLAMKELNPPADYVDQVKLGDDWWNSAEKEKTESTEKTARRIRAAYWYRKARPKLAGLLLAKVRKRLSEIEPVAVASVNQPENELLETPSFRKHSLSPKQVASFFGLSPENWGIGESELKGKVGHRDKDGQAILRPPFTTPAFEFGFNIRSKWYHRLIVLDEKNTYSYTRGASYNTRSEIHDTEGTRRLEGKVSSGEQWHSMKVSYADHVLKYYYDGEIVGQSKVPGSERNTKFVVGFGSHETYVGIKDVYFSLPASTFTRPKQNALSDREKLQRARNIRAARVAQQREAFVRMKRAYEERKAREREGKNDSDKDKDKKRKHRD